MGETTGQESSSVININDGATGTVVGDYATVTIYKGQQVVIPSLEAVAAHRAALRQWLADRARGRWGEMSAYIQEEGAALPLEASPYDQGRLGARENLLSTLRSADRLLVLGEPGAGKTVALERLAWELCDGPEPVIPVLIPLFNYAGTPLAEWVCAKLMERGCLWLNDLNSLEAFLRTPPTRCFFLFDGLNEVTPSYRDMLADELTRWMGKHPLHPVICTSRSQDEIWRRLRGEVRTVVVQPIDDKQAEGYLKAHLGKEKGKALYERLDERLKAMARRPLILWLIKEAGEAGESIPGNRGELYKQFVSRILDRDSKRRIAVDIPDPLKLKALAELAYALGLKQRLFCSREDAVAIVATCMEPDRARSVIEACLRHGLLAGEETISFAPHQTVQEYFAAEALLERWKQEQGGGVLKRALRTVVGKPENVVRLAAQDWWLETFVQFAGLSEDPDALAAAVVRVNPWLAWWCVEEGHEVSEKAREAIAVRSVKLLESESVSDRFRAVEVLAKMQNDRAVGPLFKAAGDADAEIAGIAMQSLDQMGEVVKPFLEPALRGTDRRQWKVALRYLLKYPDNPSEHVMELLFRMAADEDNKSADLAVQVLDQMGEAVHPLVKAALQRADHSQWRSAFRYLATQPQDLLRTEISWDWEKVMGFEMVYVPPGPFWMGSDEAEDSLAFYNAAPKHQVTLPGYWIAKTPVTVAQFRAFVEAEGYKTDEDALKGPDDHPVGWVGWDDALAYCRWQSKRTGLMVTLPSEAEWEKAARGTDGRPYPWGNAKPDARLCNFDNHEKGTTPVGHYSPQGDSPYGCVDMAGNVWEWTRSLWGKNVESPDFRYPYDFKDGRENLESRDPRVLRGGAFDFSASYVRCVRRHWLYRYFTSGFRPILSPYL